MATKPITISQAIDRVNDAYFWGERLAMPERESIARAIVDSYAKPGAYVDTFALPPAEAKRGLVLFTGEKATSASARHVAAEESCRALRLLGKLKSTARIALDDATDALQQCLRRAEADRDHRMGGSAGLFCCGRCSVSVWRHALAGGFDRREERLTAGISALKKFRTGRGTWQYFPFWYTVSALAEAEASIAGSEIKYAAKSLERAVAKRTMRSEFDRRRIEIARRALSRV